MVLRKKCGLPETDRDRTCPVKRSGAGNGISRSLNAQPPDICHHLGGRHRYQGVQKQARGL